jgi:hypothetical protein
MAMTLDQFGIDRLNPQQRCELIDFIWVSPTIPPSLRPPGTCVSHIAVRDCTTQA